MSGRLTAIMSFGGVPVEMFPQVVDLLTSWMRAGQVQAVVVVLTKSNVLFEVSGLL